VVAGRLPARMKKHWLHIQLCAWSGALALLAFAGVRLFVYIAIAMLVLGLTGAVGNIEFGSYLVRNAKDDMLGRVTSIGQVTAIAAVGLGPLLGGAAISAFGLRAAISLLCYLVAAGALALFFVPCILSLTAQRPYRYVLARRPVRR
jgi:MFS family permease